MNIVGVQNIKNRMMAMEESTDAVEKQMIRTNISTMASA